MKKEKFSMPWIIKGIIYTAFGEAHSILCSRITNELTSKGYKVTGEKCIKTHPYIGHGSSVKDCYYVDIFVERRNEIVIVECGNCSNKKLDHLKRIFPLARVFNYPYLTQWECTPKRCFT
jgi:hypothetical protein